MNVILRWDSPQYIKQDGIIVGELKYDSGGMLSRFRGKNVEATFDAGWPKSWKREDGYEQKVSYYPNGILKQLSDNKSGKVNWLKDGRLSSANMPDGLILRAHYKERHDAQLSDL